MNVVSETSTPGPPQPFAYRVRVPDGADGGLHLDGRLHAPDAEQARETLTSAGLVVLSLEPVAMDTAAASDTGRRLGPLEFASFNRQFAQLTSAGMPVASGLRLIAADIRRGRLSRSIEAVAGELEQGAGLGEAFDRHRGAFPPLYAQLIEVGVQTGRLPGVLLNLGEHLARVNRLRIALWRAVAYPMTVLAMLLLVILGWAVWIAPHFDEIYQDFGTELPALTRWAIDAAGWVVPVVCVVVVALVGVPLVWWLADRLRLGVSLRERWLRALPLLGPTLSRGTVARWCGLMRMGIDAGVDLPTAMRLAGRASASPALLADSEALAARIERGDALDELSTGRLHILPEAVPASLGLAAAQADLSGVFENLEALYGQQAEMRLGSLQAVLAPMLLMVLAGLIGVMVLAMFLPLVKLMSSLL
ncbi:MAG: type II secretion system F family protein [Planctomycetota bacterium]